MNRKNILVTGGAGFIGSHYIRQTLSKYKKYNIVNLDALTYAGNLENLIDVVSCYGKRYSFVKGNILDSKVLVELFGKYKFDYVVHFAAESHVDNSILSAKEFIKTNFEGTFNLLNISKEYKVSKFLHISTDEVYGDVRRGNSKENSAFAPSSPYSSSKAAADLLVQSYVRTHNFPAMIVRGANNFGTHQYPEKIIPAVITSILEKRKVLIHGSGSQTRTWLHVLDFCKAINMVLDSANPGDIYNVGGVKLSVTEIVNKISFKLNVKPKDVVMRVTDRPGQDMRYSPDDFLIRKQLGWKPDYSVDSSLGEIVEWYVNNKSWWKKLKKSKSFKKNEKIWQGVRVIKEDIKLKNKKK